MEMFLAPLPIVYTNRNLFVLQEYSHVDDFNNRNNFLTITLLKQGYQCQKLRKAFSKSYYQHSESIVKCNICLKTLLQQSRSEPVFYVDLVYEFKRIVVKPNFSDQFKKIIKRYKRVEYNMDIMRQVVNQITVDNSSLMTAMT